MNKICLVFLQSIKVILTLFFMPTILFTNLILMQIYATQAKTGNKQILYLCIQANTNKLEKTQERTLRFCSQ